MTIPVFPALNVVGWPRKRSPTWSTLRQKSISGQETSLQLWSYPEWKYELTFDLLRSAAAFQEWQNVVGCFNKAKSGSGIFSFTDPADCTASMQPIGVGDGVTTIFQLVRSLGGFVEPVWAPLTTTLLRSDWQGLVQISSAPRTNLLTTSTPGGSGWTANNATPTLGATGPDGTASATLLVEGTASGAGVGLLAPSCAVSAGAPYTDTMWGKPYSGGAKRYLVAFFGTDFAGGYQAVVFDLVLGTAVATNTTLVATMTPGTGGWWRCTATCTIASGTTSTRPAWRMTASASDIYANQAGDGASGLYLAKAQFEAGTVATSAIDTDGAAVTVADYSVGDTGGIVFAAAPAAGTSLLWSGTFAWLCRFDEDTLEFQQDYNAFWSLKSCTFTTVKL